MLTVWECSEVRECGKVDWGVHRVQEHRRVQASVGNQLETVKILFSSARERAGVSPHIVIPPLDV